MLELDHVVIAAADLEAAAVVLEERYGLHSVEGSRHPEWGPRTGSSRSALTSKRSPSSTRTRRRGADLPSECTPARVRNHGIAVRPNTDDGEVLSGEDWPSSPGAVTTYTRGHQRSRLSCKSSHQVCRECPRMTSCALAHVPVSYLRGVVVFRNRRRPGVPAYEVVVSSASSVAGRRTSLRTVDSSSTASWTRLASTFGTEQRSVPAAPAEATLRAGLPRSA